MAHPIVIEVTAEETGHAYIRSANQANGNDGDYIYVTPTYLMKVSGWDSAGTFHEFKFNVIRFGAECPPEKEEEDGDAEPLMRVCYYGEKVGPNPANIYNYWPDKLQGNPHTTGPGAWQIFQGFEIHSGPANPLDPWPAQGFISDFGCIQICGDGKWQEFNNDLLKLSGALTPEALSESLKSLSSSMVIKFDTVPIPATLPIFRRNSREQTCDELDEGLEFTQPPPRPDPLILDLDRDGIQLARGAYSDEKTYFDYDGNGLAVSTEWVDPNDGLLVTDRNGNGIIDNGSELFGSDTLLKDGTKASNGFQALADLDSNHDGKIDASDPAFSQLLVWQDSDGDGVSQPEELFTLDQLGITAINLDSAITNITDDQGNTQTSLGSFQWADGTAGEIGEYKLQTDTTSANPTQVLDVPADIAALPDLSGFGQVYNLQQAMARDTSGHLKSLVQQFISTTDPTALDSLTQQILFTWTGVDGIDPTSRGPNIDARKLGVLEKYAGQSFVWANGPDPTYNCSITLNESYRQIFETMEGQLMSETHLKGLYDEIAYTWDSDKQQVTTNLSAVITGLQNALASNPDQGKQLLSEFARSLRGTEMLSENDYLTLRETFIDQDPSLGWVFDTGGLPVYNQRGQSGQGWYSQHMFGTDEDDAIQGPLTGGDGFINGMEGNDVIYGTDRDEHIYSGSGDSLIVAGGGNDTVYAGAGNDILDGGPGNDVLYGEAGNDTYIFRRGSGQDTIIDDDPTAGNVDTIFLGSSLTPDDITLKRTGNDLLLKINDTTDTLTVRNFFWRDGTQYRVEQIQFMDGTIWDETQIVQIAYSPTDGDDVFFLNRLAA